jgi:hypothetical protein
MATKALKEKENSRRDSLRFKKSRKSTTLIGCNTSLINARLVGKSSVKAPEYQNSREITPTPKN